MLLLRALLTGTYVFASVLISNLYTPVTASDLSFFWIQKDLILNDGRKTMDP